MADDERQERRLRVSEKREQRFQRQETRRAGSSAGRAARAPGRAAKAVTQRSGTYSGKGMLTAELLIGFVIVLIRVVADYEVQNDGTVKGKVLHPQGQYGPLPILVGLIGTFFMLSFVAAAGGTRAKLAVVFGGVVVTALGVQSAAEIDTVASTIGAIGSITVPPPSGTESSGASNPNTGLNIPTGTTAPATGSVSPIPLIPTSIFPGGTGTTGATGTTGFKGRTVPSTGPGSASDPLA